MRRKRTLALSNVIAVAMLLLGAPWLARSASIRARLPLPFVIVLIMAAIAYNARKKRSLAHHAP